jgi:hypothetical protein
MTYRPRFQTQRVASDPYGRFNCAAYAMAMLVDYTTLGGTVITGAALRALTDEPKPTPGSPGLTVPQVLAAARLLRVQVASNPAGTANALVANLGWGRCFVVPGIYSHVPDSLSGDPSYDKGHAVLAVELVPGRANVVIGDPLKSGWVEWPIALLLRYWRAYGSIYAFSRPVHAAAA